MQTPRFLFAALAGLMLGGCEGRDPLGPEQPLIAYSRPTPCPRCPVSWK